MGKKRNTAEKIVETAVEVMTTEPAVEEGAEITVGDAEIDEVVAAIEVDEAKRKAYASMEAEEPVEGAAAPAPAPSDATTEMKAKAARTPRASLLTHKASELIRQVLGENAHEFFQLNKSGPTDKDGLVEQMNRTLEAIDKLDKKSREKAVNLFSAIASGRTPSVYTRQAILALQKHGTLTLKDLVNVYQTEFSYKPGTARRQASEMFALLPVVKIANREPTRGAPMTLNPESVLLEKLAMSSAARS